MRVSSGLVISLLGAVPVPCAAMFYYPNPAASALEHILVDNWGAYASNFSSAITPCDRYVTEVGQPAINSHRTTAAQWLRVAFHDFAIADVAAGTGGIDASIGFETERAENSGSAFNDSFTFWQPFVNEFVPMADLLAVGTVMSVHLCGGKYIPYQYGRIDAKEADPKTGVPEPSTSAEETLAQFEQAGFNQADAIGLTACGHTMGSVHAGGFPEVVEQSAITPTNTNGAVNLDSSRAVFDSVVVHEYIDNTGQRGGPLVTSFNELGRMLNTVPSDVQLQPAITPALIKPINVTWDVTSDDQLILSGKIRVREVQHSERKWWRRIAFSIPSTSIPGASLFTVAANGFEPQDFQIQDQGFVLPGLTNVVNGTVIATVAARTNSPDFDPSQLAVTVTAPMAQPLTLAPKIVRTTIHLAEVAGPLDDIGYWSGSTAIEKPSCSMRELQVGRTCQHHPGNMSASYTSAHTVTSLLPGKSGSRVICKRYLPIYAVAQDYFIQ